MEVKQYDILKGYDIPQANSLRQEVKQIKITQEVPENDQFVQATAIPKI